MSCRRLFSFAVVMLGLSLARQDAFAQQLQLNGSVTPSNTTAPMTNVTAPPIISKDATSPEDTGYVTPATYTRWKGDYSAPYQYVRYYGYGLYRPWLYRPNYSYWYPNSYNSYAFGYPYGYSTRPYYGGFSNFYGSYPNWGSTWYSGYPYANGGYYGGGFLPGYAGLGYGGLGYGGMGYGGFGYGGADGYVGYGFAGYGNGGGNCGPGSYGGSCIGAGYGGSYYW